MVRLQKLRSLVSFWTLVKRSSLFTIFRCLLLVQAQSSSFSLVSKYTLYLLLIFSINVYKTVLSAAENKIVGDVVAVSTTTTTTERPESKAVPPKQDFWTTTTGYIVMATSGVLLLIAAILVFFYVRRRKNPKFLNRPSKFH